MMPTNVSQWQPIETAPDVAPEVIEAGICEFARLLPDAEEVLTREQSAQVVLSIYQAMRRLENRS